VFAGHQSALAKEDLETAGLKDKRHSIIQIAAIAVDDNLQTLETFEAKIRFDERRANRNSLRKNHYHRGIWAKNVLEREDAARQFAEFLRRHASVAKMGSDGEPYHLAQLVAHNAPFDAEFLWAWYERLYMFLPASCQVFCTLQRAMWHFQEYPDEIPPIDFRLATLCNHFGVPFDAASAHDALGDVTATVALCRAMHERSFHLQSRQNPQAHSSRQEEGNAEPVSQRFIEEHFDLCRPLPPGRACFAIR
jgi:DNA polymerase III epsilon subunit-like protein